MSESKNVKVEKYRIGVKEHLDPSWSEWLGGWTILPQEGDGTILTGPVADQAALHGILNKMYAMNLTLLFVERVQGEDRPVKGKFKKETLP
jgi:hypothetical protein